MARLAYFDCFSGVAGDMIVGALLDAGADVARLKEALATLDVGGYRVELARVKRSGLAVCQFLVHMDDDHDNSGPSHGHQHHHHHHHHHRPLSEILRLIDGSRLSDSVKAAAGRVFRRLGEVEAKAHDVPIEAVQFHEVGAVDAIVDIVGACVCLEMLGVEDVCFSAIPVGSGTVETSHGRLPVPAPATAGLLEGFRVYGGGEGELTTPTGAAVLTTLGRQVERMPEMRIARTGYGAGTRDPKVAFNALRVVLGDPSAAEAAECDEVTELTCQIDDMTGEELGFLADRLRAAGALDVWFGPIYMKKSRPAVRLDVLAALPDADRLIELLLTESTTFGLRRHTARRLKLARRFIQVGTAGGEVNVKLGYYAGRLAQVSPEYEDCRRVAEAAGRPLREIVQSAAVEARRRAGQADEKEA